MPSLCGGCFEGVGSSASRRGNNQPDVSPSVGRRGARDRVAGFEQGYALERPDAGTFIPTPSVNYHSPPWASPVPRKYSSEDQGLDLDFDFVIEDGPKKKNSSATVALDTDIPRRRVGNFLEPQKRSKYEVEMLVASPGSLPAPMTADQREAAIRSMLPTATFQMLARVPPALLQQSSFEAQKLRRTLTHGATVVFISAGLSGKKFTFERAAELGIKCVIIDHPDSWSRSLVDEGIVAKFLPVDMSQSSDQVHKSCLEAIRSLGQDGVTGEVDGIASYVELSVPLVSRLCEALGLPGHRPTAVDSARNKHATRACLRAAGMPTPANALIKCEAECAMAAKTVGFPAVLKPVSGAASLGVIKVNNAEEMKKAYSEVVTELSSLVVSSGALVTGTGSGGAGFNAASMVDLTILMEQYLDGPEVDVDVIYSEGEWKYAAVADNGPTLEPYFNETWAVCPSLLPKDQQKACKDLAVAAVGALGFYSGVFHVECKFTSNGPHLIEVNARMGGGQVHECNLRTWGVDLVEETLFACLGIPAAPSMEKMPLIACAYAYVNADKSGTASDLSALELLRKRNGVVWAKPLVQAGAKVVGPADGLPTWLCDLFVESKTPQAALEFLQAIEAEHPVKVE